MDVTMSMRNKFFFLMALWFFAVAGASDAASLDEKVIKTRLDNGLTVLMLQRSFSPTVSLYIRYRVGAVDEIPGQTGAAHFLEHMMFKGTTTIGTKDYAAEKPILEQIEETGNALDDEKRKGDSADKKVVSELSARLKTLQDEHRRFYIPNEIDRLYKQNGGMEMNANTGQDMTTYLVNLPANKIELWARIESDRLKNPVFREFYTERDVVLEERNQMVESRPQGKLYETFISTAYTAHPYRTPVLGWPKDMANMSPEGIRNIYRKYAAPQNIVIAAVGDIDPQKTLKLIKKYFGDIPRSNLSAPEIPPEPPQTSERRVEVEFDASPMMIIGYHKPPPPAYENYVFDVMETILSRGRTSRFYSRLVMTQQIAESVDIHNGLPGSRYRDLFAIFATPRHPHTVEDLQRAIDEELDDIIRQPVSKAELDRARKQLKVDFIRNLESNESLASILSYYELLVGDYRYFADYLAQIEKITPEDISKVAAKYLTHTNRTTATLKRKKDDSSHAK